MKKVYLILLLCVLSIAGYAQTAASYYFSRSTGTYTSIAGTGTALTLINCDDCYTTGISLGGISFNFAGTNYTSVSVSSNGTMSLANASTNSYPGSATSIASAGWLFPMWRDLHGGYGGASCYYQTSGSSPNRVFTFEWFNWDEYNLGGTQDMNVQIKLFEGTNRIQFCYGTATPATSDFSIGIGNSSSDYQRLVTVSDVTTSSTGFTTGTNAFPANGTILQWCPPAPTPTGPTSVCIGGNITLSDALAGGTWVSPNASIATINSSTGVITGIATGAAPISYVTPCGAVTVVTVNVLPAPATPSGNVPFPNCTTITLTDASGSGTWSSSGGAATINPTTGVVTGVSVGTSNITFTLTSTGCTTNTTVTVTALPASTGGSLVCVTGSFTLSNAVTGGTFSSTNTGQATVNSTTGVVTGVATGNPSIVYTATGGCTTSLPITVNALPAAIGGSLAVCAGSNVTLTDATTGGTWTSSNPGVGTIDASAGILTGLSAGNTTITYTVTGAGCIATRVETVNVASAITGSTAICNGYSTALSNTTPGGGTWASSNTGVATVNSSGVVTSVSVGSATITFTSTATGCTATFLVNVTPPPSPYTVTGGGSYCNVSGGGALVGLNGSDAGVTYSLFSGATLVTNVTGTGGLLSFGTRPAGTYNVVANYGTPCASTMLGSATVTANPLPTAYAVINGGTYCVGGSGVAVGLANSTIGVNYQLFYNGSPIGSPVAGTGGTFSFGLQTGVGTYTVVGTNASTLCTNNMTGSATVATNALPAPFSVLGTGGYCVGGAGVPVGLSGSAIGTNYQLLIGGAPVGGIVSGTGSAITFGNQTAAGVYTVVATNVSTGCTGTMSGSATVTVNPLPTTFTVTGGGAYCAGGTGVVVGLNSSQVGVNYQLISGGSSVGATVAGTGTSISFGLQTTAGSYTVVATNATTTCTNNMTGSALVTITPLPVSSSVTGGGGYCIGGAGVPVGLAGSATGVTYQLFNGGTLVGGASGSGSAIAFGNQTAAGTYTVVATNTTTGCIANMSGSVTVVINPLPSVFTVTSSATSYCAGGTGVTIGLSGSTSGVNYQLFNGGSPVGSVVAGTNAAISFGLQTLAGSYTVVAINAATTCTNNMAGSALITINPLPAIYTITGGGGYCTGGTGVNIGLSSSNLGITYQLYSSAGASGAAVAGTGSAISFGLRTVASARDSVVATNNGTGCVSVMSGNVPVIINALPTQYSVTGSGSYCAGGTGLSVFLGGSSVGVNYQLFKDGVPVGSPVNGTNSALVFGPVTAGGNYTIAATNVATTCVSNMSGSATIAVNPVPAVYTVTGGGAYCSGGAGSHIGLSSSTSGINYQLYLGGVVNGPLVPGTGLPIDFGFKTAAGTYTVVAITPITLCQSNMSGSAAITISTLPTAFTITQSATSYCAGGTGVHIGLSGSSVGVSYQLMNLTSPAGAPLLGTGSALDFGLITPAGNYTIIATNSFTGCSRTMTGTATLVVNSLPNVHAVIGGGAYCPGGAGVVIGVNASELGNNYILYNGGTAVGAPVPGTAGLPISFGLQTAAGIYTVMAVNTTTSCASNMLGSATVVISPLPVVYNVTGGGNYCAGGTGANVGLSGSSTGVQYQLMAGSAPIGAAISGTGLPLSFGPQTTIATYTVMASDITTGCNNTMFGSVNVGNNPAPTAYSVMGGGDYCAGGAGLSIGLDGSDVGTSYHMLLSGVAVGPTVAGTGSAVSFGAQTASGTYTVVALNNVTGCTGSATGSATININALPSVFNVNGGGTFCVGGAGLEITTDGSDPTATYQLYNGGLAVGASVDGTGSGLTFGMQTAAGTYTVVASDLTTGCSVNLTGTVTIGITAPPVPYIVSGGGNYCAGGSGAHIMLSGSNTGISYQLYVDGLASGITMPGTGSAINFNGVMGAGAYTIIGTNTATGCVNNMIGTVSVGINPLPAAHAVVTTSSSYCAGGSGVEISLDNSDPGISYQLYTAGGLPVGTAVEGVSAVISFGYVTATGSYTVKAKNTVTGCMVNMLPSVSVTISALPAVFAVTGGGHYCDGTTGVHIGMASSNAGISYQLYRAGTPVGTAVAGTGTALDFGLQTAAGTYTVVGTNNATTCTNNMSGSATVTIDAMPSAFTITGGGNYCAGGTGAAISLSNSAIGITYQLMRGPSVSGSAVAGTGSAISFGPQTIAGAYTVTAINSITGCTGNMTGSVTVSVNALPSVYTTTGGGIFCPGGTGVAVGVSNSATGVTYQLYNGTGSVGTGVAGVTGAPVTFGLITAPGAYYVVGSNNTTGCTATMGGTATVTISPLPVAYNVAGGGNFCVGGTGVHVGLGSSNIGVNYALYKDGSTLVTTLPGTGGPLDFGFQTAAGAYTVVGINPTTGCSANMTGSATVVVNALVTPLVTVTDGPGDTVCSGSFVTYSASTVNAGTTPSFVWTVNGVAVGSGSTYGFIPVNGDVVGVTLTSSQTCAFPSSVSASKAMTVDASQIPAVSISADPGTEVCAGTMVTFSAMPSFGGTAPTYSWVKNGVSVSTAATFSYIPVDGDNIYCVMTSNYHCRLSNTASSEHLSINVAAPLLPVVTITATPGNHIAAGQTATLLATITNGGPAPSIQWFVNGNAVVGATHNTYSSSFSDGDSVTCQVLSSGGCVGLRGVNSITMHVANVGVQPVTLAGSDLVLIPNPNSGVFTLKGAVSTQNAQDNVTIEVVNMLGQVVYSHAAPVIGGNIDQHITLANVANGMYILNVRSGAESKVFHFVIEQ